MLKYIELRWSNCFSYGANNKIRFDENPITQLVGKNGHGKSSIALILEEVQFNKNSKGIKKGSILNRNNGAKSYSIELDFEKDGSSYTISTSRSSTQKVSFVKDGIDISSHTATSTFKDIENVLGFDHNTFGQIVYQSSTSSLEFLTATDTQRKKFLIELLNLSRYADALNTFKDAASTLAKQVTVVETKVNSAKSWIAKYSDIDLTRAEIMEVPEPPVALQAEWQEVFAEKADISNRGRLIAQNNKYKELRDSVVLLPAPTLISQSTIDELRAHVAVVGSQIAAKHAEMLKLTRVKTKCPTCGTIIGENHEQIQSTVAALGEEVKELEDSLKGTTLELTHANALQVANRAYQERVAEYEKYHALYNPELPEVAPSISELEARLLQLDTEIKGRNKDIKIITDLNATAVAKNARLDLVESQLSDMQKELEEYSAELAAKAAKFSNLQILVKAFSTTGLVAYKIEGLVKELEDITNEHLAEMSDGRFLLGFEISSSDKLNVVITDNGADIDINALSTGERARVNIATLLAIRKLMQSLSSTKTNLLILDETVENLDAEGKEKLIEVLIAEEELNTVLISHSFTHPLIERIGIIKEDNISRIESNG